MPHAEGRRLEQDVNRMTVSVEYPCFLSTDRTVSTISFISLLCKLMMGTLDARRQAVLVLTYKTREVFLQVLLWILGAFCLWLTHTLNVLHAMTWAMTTADDMI